MPQQRTPSGYNPKGKSTLGASKDPRSKRERNADAKVERQQPVSKRARRRGFGTG